MNIIFRLALKFDCSKKKCSFLYVSHYNGLKKVLYHIIPQSIAWYSMQYLLMKYKTVKYTQFHYYHNKVIRLMMTLILIENGLYASI